MTTDRDLVRSLGPTGQAFYGRFHALREVQRRSIEPVLAGEDVLLSSATASGKTEAVFAPLVARISSQMPVRKDAILVLAVAPTRALVNDLHARLERPLGEIGWSCGRQTSDHRDKGRRPNVLITTPESFDSMLVRDSEWKHGVLTGHLLAEVQAVFIDEAHLFEFSPRGAQLVWQLGRLRRLRRHAVRERWTSGAHVQACAASATVSRPEELAHKLLGDGSRAVLVAGSREIEMLGGVATADWLPVEHLNDLDAIYENLLFTDGPDDMDAIVQHVWRAIERGAETGCRKVLVFVPSRALCDRLSLALADALKSRRDLYVGAHHGSLERPARELAERDFSLSRDAVLVATTTLEVGIDIGDVDVVAIVGAPPDTSSLLQRIGRSGRRNGRVRVVPIVRDPMEGRALCSMLDAACRGALDASPQTRLWSVFIQQAASHSAQARGRGRRRADLLSLAEDVWPEPAGPITATRILDSLVEQGVLVEAGERLHLGEQWSDRFERAGGDVHHNFDSGGQGIPVVDTSTGEILTYVLEAPTGHSRVALAGRGWKVRIQSGEILVSSSVRGSGAGTFRYAARAAPTGKNYAEHVRRGLGFQETDAPIVDGPRGHLWFHFGGSAYEAILAVLLPDLKGVRGLSGIALRGVVTESMLRAIAGDHARLTEQLHELADAVVMPTSLGRYHRLLPEDVRKKVTLERLNPDEFRQWLGSRRPVTPIALRQAEQRLRIAMGWTHPA